MLHTRKRTVIVRKKYTLFHLFESQNQRRTRSSFTTSSSVPLSLVAASRLRMTLDSSDRPSTLTCSFSFSLSDWAAIVVFESAMTSSSCESIDHTVSMRSSPRAVAAGDGASWDEEGKLCSMLFTNAVNAVGVRGCLGGHRERVAERREWYVVTRASAALESAGVE